MPSSNELTGAELRQRRSRLGFSQGRLVEYLGVTPNTVARWERGLMRIGNTGRVCAALTQLEDGQHGQRCAQAPGKADAASRLTPIRRFWNRLPRQLTAFVGREENVATVSRLLHGSVVLTLTGTGGIGKTRLALEVASRESVAYSDGVCTIELAAVVDPAMITQAVATALGLPEEVGKSLKESIIEVVRDRQVLLIIDNCEHVLEAAAELVETLAAAAPHVRMLATSREPLGIAGETMYRVPPLASRRSQAITAESAEWSDSLRFFVQHAQAVQPDFHLAAEDVAVAESICQRLGGLPLAIELAVPNIDFLSLAELLAEVSTKSWFTSSRRRGGPLRHRTMHAAIAWSYELLPTRSVGCLPDSRSSLEGSLAKRPQRYVE